MKITLFTVIAAVGLTTLAACGGSENGPPVSSTSGGSSSSGSSGSGSTSSGPNSNSSAPTDFVAFVNEQILVQTQPAFGTAPAATTGLTTDLGLGNSQAFIVYQFGAGDALPAKTYSAFAACTQVGVMACNPAVSADLNSTEN
jgi:hypothetical protein